MMTLIYDEKQILHYRTVANACKLHKHVTQQPSGQFFFASNPLFYIIKDKGEREENGSIKIHLDDCIL